MYRTMYDVQVWWWVIVGLCILFCQLMGSDSWSHRRVPPSAKSLAAWSSPRSTHLVVNRPSTPTGPRAWMRAVDMPTSAPNPKRKPSANRELALWKTHALSTCCWKPSAFSPVKYILFNWCEKFTSEILKIHVICTSHKDDKYIQFILSTTWQFYPIGTRAEFCSLLRSSLVRTLNGR